MYGACATAVSDTNVFVGTVSLANTAVPRCAQLMAQVFVVVVGGQQQWLTNTREACGDATQCRGDPPARLERDTAMATSRFNGVRRIYLTKW